MAKCEGCGEYHPVADCEIVVIKIVKGKGCGLPSNRAAPSKPAFRSNVDDRDNRVDIVEEPKVDAPPPPRKKIIPPGIAAMMIDPGNPNFEQFGSKEKRYA